MSLKITIQIFNQVIQHVFYFNKTQQLNKFYTKDKIKMKSNQSLNIANIQNKSNQNEDLI